MVDGWQRTWRRNTFRQAGHIPATLDAFQFRRPLHTESVVARKLNRFTVLHFVKRIQWLRFCLADVLRLRNDGIGAVFSRCD